MTVDHTKPFRSQRPLALLLALFATAAAAAEPPSPYRTLPAKSNVLATVRYVLKVTVEGMGEEEMEGKTTCPFIDSKGLLLCSNTELGGYVTLMGRMMGPEGANLTAAPTDLKVVVDGGPEEMDATLLARDSDRDLAWVRVVAGEDRTFPHLDFAATAEAGVGDTLYALRVMDPFFGRAPLIVHYRVAAVTSKPRRLLVPETARPGTLGMPVFTAGGKLVGIVVLQMPSAEEQVAATMGARVPFLGEAARFNDMLAGLVMPAAEVLEATDLAKKSFPAPEPEEEGGDGGKGPE